MESFGARLKREREQRKMTLDDISVSTKIGTRFLAALEEERFDQLPGGIFNKWFVRAYARHLGIDENQAIADFVAASAPSLPETPPEEPPVLAAMAVRVPESKRKSRGNDGIPWGIVAAVLLILAFGFALWGFHSREKPVPGVTVPPPVQTESSTTGLRKAAPEPVPATSQPVAAPALQSPPGPSASAPEAVPPAAVTAATTAGAFQVLIQAREDSWVSITADGKQIFEDTLTAPAEKSVEARNQIVIKAGNSAPFDISFNRKNLASQNPSHRINTLTFDPGGLRP